ncbi:hypothetical protein ABFX02_03G073100 [Erythranthe guttata]
MEAISTYKSHIGNPKKSIIHHHHRRHPFISTPPSENFFPPHDLIHHVMGGGLLQPPPPSLRRSFPASHSYPPYSVQLQQPPLLPLPAAAHRRPAAARGLSCPPAASKKANSPKKSPKSPTKKEEKKISPSEEADMFSGTAAFAVLSPPPSSLPLPTFSVRPKALISCCKAEAAAAGIDTGATDNLRRLLRLR